MSAEGLERIRGRATGGVHDSQNPVSQDEGKAPSRVHSPGTLSWAGVRLCSRVGSRLERPQGSSLAAWDLASRSATAVVAPYDASPPGIDTLREEHSRQKTQTS